MEEKAKQKVQQLFAAFDAACAKHKELQKAGVKELFSNMRFYQLRSRSKKWRLS